MTITISVISDPAKVMKTHPFCVILISLSQWQTFSVNNLMIIQSGRLDTEQQDVLHRNESCQGNLELFEHILAQHSSAPTLVVFYRNNWTAYTTNLCDPVRSERQSYLPFTSPRPNEIHTKNQRNWFGKHWYCFPLRQNYSWGQPKTEAIVQQ